MFYYTSTTSILFGLHINSRNVENSMTGDIENRQWAASLFNYLTRPSHMTSLFPLSLSRGVLSCRTERDQWASKSFRAQSLPPLGQRMFLASDRECHHSWKAIWLAMSGKSEFILAEFNWWRGLGVLGMVRKRQEGGVMWQEKGAQQAFPGQADGEREMRQRSGTCARS